MNRKTKIILGIAIMLALIFLLPRAARRIDSVVDPRMEEAAANEAQYRDMTNAFPIAGEVMPEHPTRRLYKECKTALLAKGYLETRELRISQRFEAKRFARTFFTSFHSRFPGVECAVQRSKETETPVAIVTARKSDFPSIERFVSRYESTK